MDPSCNHFVLVHLLPSAPTCLWVQHVDLAPPSDLSAGLVTEEKCEFKKLLVWRHCGMAILGFISYDLHLILLFLLFIIDHMIYSGKFSEYN